MILVTFDFKRIYFRFYGLFPVSIFYFIKNCSVNQFSQIICHNSKLKWVKGQISNLGSSGVKFRTLLNEGKFYIKMTLLTSALKKLVSRSPEVNRGHQRSLEVKNLGKMLKLRVNRNLLSYIGYIIYPSNAV